MAVAGLVALVVAVRIGSDDGNDGEENNSDLIISNVEKNCFIYSSG